MQRHMQDLHKLILKNQSLLQQQIENTALEKKRLSVEKKKLLKAKKKNKQKDKKEEKRKPTEILADLNNRLKIINGYQEKKQLDKASTLLGSFKKEIWKARKQKGFDRKNVLSIISSIDITLKRWKAKENTYTTNKIKKKMKTLSVAVGASRG